MKARELLESLLFSASWIDRTRTVDRIITGNPEKLIRKVIVTWMCGRTAVETARKTGADCVICHEPLFWDHEDDPRRRAENPRAVEKEALLFSADIVVIRIHDLWDRMPEVGIPWAWARFLGFGDRPGATAADGQQHRYDIPPRSLREFAALVAERTAAVGEPVVQLSGDPDWTVSRIGIGTGCICDIDLFREMGCDAAVVTDDGSLYWKGIQEAADSGFGIVRVNHGTSEEPGMRSLRLWLSRRFPEISFQYLPHGSCFYPVGTMP